VALDGSNSPPVFDSTVLCSEVVLIRTSGVTHADLHSHKQNMSSFTIVRMADATAQAGASIAMGRTKGDG
jgi:hypothetical protein